MIGVIGGGLAGLAAAYRLQRRGHDVRVFEASDSLGGLAATVETAGDPLERYYHHLSRSERTIVELCRELGLGDDLEWRVGKNAYYVDGVVHPLDTPWQILAYPHMSVYDKFRLALLTKGVDVRGGRPRFDTYDDLEVFEHVSVESFVREHTTDGVYESFFEPLLSAKFGARASDVSAAWLLGRVKFRGERDLLRGEILGYLRGGFGRLTAALVDAIGRDRITTRAEVTALKGDGGGVESLTVETDSGTDRVDVDAVVVATIPNVLESLTGYTCNVEFQGSVCAVVGLKDALTDTYWLNLADDARFGALIEHTNFVPVERYGDEHLLYLASYVQDRTDPLWRRSDEAIEAYWLDGIEDLFPSFDHETVTRFTVSRNPRTAPVYERGYLDMVVPTDLATVGHPGVYYAGMASRSQYPERSLDGAIQAGYRAADTITERA